METLLVTALYRFESKRPLDAYISCVKTLIMNTICDTVIFTTEDLTYLIPKRKGVEIIILPVDEWYSNVYASPKEYEEMVKKYNDMSGKNGNTIYNSNVNLIKIYAEKHIFVNRAINLFSNYSYYVWHDIGGFVNNEITHYFSSFPSINKIRALNIENKVCFCILNDITINHYKSGIVLNSHNCAISGSMIIGNKYAWRKFIGMYQTSLRFLQENDGYWGNDEHVYFHMLCKNPIHVIGINIHGDLLPIPTSIWSRAKYLLSDSYTTPLTLFEPIKEIIGYPNVKNALWGVNGNNVDVTDFFNNKKDTSQMHLKHTLFEVDPAPGFFKYLTIEYHDGTIQKQKEWDVFNLIEPK